MLRDEIDDLYRKSFRSVQDENSFPCSVFDRYEFAKLVAAKERDKLLLLSIKAHDVDGHCNIVLAADIRARG